jgi:ubiquinone/menaquinone biosynthesis C-methylase UbiE
MEKDMPKQQPIDPQQTSEIHQRVNAQFGAAAAAYSSSLTHSDPGALSRVVELADPRPEYVVLDIATGAGHTALALAPHVSQVIAYDMTNQMLVETRRNAIARGLTNVLTRQGTAEALPFPEESFDIVTVRQAPHHYADVRTAVREMARVVKRGGRIVIIDSVAPDDDALDQQWNHIEKLRDPSHVRNYRPTEWRAFVTEAGLRVVFEECSFATENGGPMNFDAWLRRMNAPPATVAEVTRLFQQASTELAAALRIQIVDGAIFFCVPLIAIAAIRD